MWGYLRLRFWIVQLLNKHVCLHITRGANVSPGVVCDLVCIFKESLRILNVCMRGVRCDLENYCSEIDCIGNGSKMISMTIYIQSLQTMIKPKYISLTLPECYRLIEVDRVECRL
jgi:hypothetical protein